MSVEFILYSRSGCHLCSEMLDQLMAMEQAGTFRVRVIDIDDNPELQCRYALHIPVLSTIDNNVLCKHALDKQAVTDYLANQAG